jgi:hypothetical protein
MEVRKAVRQDSALEKDWKSAQGHSVSLGMVGGNVG